MISPRRPLAGFFEACVTGALLVASGVEAVAEPEAEGVGAVPAATESLAAAEGRTASLPEQPDRVIKGPPHI
jgi:hypothetical protein